MVGRAYQAIRELITVGNLAPGSRVVERDLARRLGMSPTPIRAALHRLEQQGYLVTTGTGPIPRVQVAPLLRADMVELFFLIGDLEGWAAVQCAERPRAVRVEAADRLAAINQALAVLSRHDPSDLAGSHRLDADWHQVIIAAGAGPRLKGLLATIKPQADRYFRLYVAALTDLIGVSVTEHAEVEAAIRRGDGPAARVALMKNWNNGGDRLGQVIDARGELGSW